MVRFAKLGSLFFVAFLGIGDRYLTETPASDANSATESQTHGQFSEWLRKLDSDRFAERNQASRCLEEAGKRAFPTLVEAAMGTSREATLRAMEILRKHSREGDEAGKNAARQALEKIAASEHPAARLAKDALRSAKPDPGGIPLGPLQAGPLQAGLIGGQQVQLQIQANALGGNPQRRIERRIEIRNGVKQIEATENDLKVKITENGTGSVQIEVTQTKDGKQATERYSADSRNELKDNQPEAYKLYEKYALQPNVRIQVQAGAGPGLPGARRPIPAAKKD